jgi:very-short-patch-repair endonuclease
LRLLEQAGLPRPECQYELKLPNGRRAFLDAAYASLLLGFEIDGHGSHATRAQRAADNARAAMIADLGWTLRRFTYDQIVNDGAAVVQAVRWLS